MCHVTYFLQLDPLPHSPFSSQWINPLMRAELSGSSHFHQNQHLRLLDFETHWTLETLASLMFTSKPQHCTFEGVDTSFFTDWLCQGKCFNNQEFRTGYLSGVVSKSQVTSVCLLMTIDSITASTDWASTYVCHQVRSKSLGLHACAAHSKFNPH